MKYFLLIILKSDIWRNYSCICPTKLLAKRAGFRVQFIKNASEHKPFSNEYNSDNVSSSSRELGAGFTRGTYLRTACMARPPPPSFGNLACTAPSGHGWGQGHGQGHEQGHGEGHGRGHGRGYGRGNRHRQGLGNTKGDTDIDNDSCIGTRAGTRPETRTVARTVTRTGTRTGTGDTDRDTETDTFTYRVNEVRRNDVASTPTWERGGQSLWITVITRHCT
jgi:hypothetical protein